MSRLDRVNELIRHELSQILLREVDLESGVLVTIIDVKTSSDLQQANILISIFPSEKTQKIFGKIQKDIFHLQQMLNKRLRMRPVPRIKFDLMGEKL